MERVLEEAKLAVLQLPSEIAMAMVAGQFVGRRGSDRKCPCDCGVAVPASTPAGSLAVASPCPSSSCHGRPRIPLAPTGIAGSGPAPLRGPWSDPDGCRQTHDGQSANHPS